MGGLRNRRLWIMITENILTNEEVSFLVSLIQVSTECIDDEETNIYIICVKDRQKTQASQLAKWSMGHVLIGPNSRLEYQ